MKSPLCQVPAAGNKNDPEFVSPHFSATKSGYYIDLAKSMADSMQFNLENGGGGNLIQRHENGAVTIGGQRYEKSLIVFPDKIVSDWPVDSLESLRMDNLKSIISAKPEVFLLGTGKTQIFPSMELMAELARNKRSVDVMDTAAACRTYNVLVSEFRQVVVALILPAG